MICKCKQSALTTCSPLFDFKMMKATLTSLDSQMTFTTVGFAISSADFSTQTTFWTGRASAFESWGDVSERCALIHLSIILSTNFVSTTMGSRPITDVSVSCYNDKICLLQSIYFQSSKPPLISP